MNAKELFSVAVKVIGLLSLGRGLGDCFATIFVALGFTTVSVTSNDYFNTLKWGILYICTGVFLIRGTAFIVNFAFPYKESEVEKKIPNKTESVD